MKHLLPLLLLFPLFCQAQTLRPKVFVADRDTSFCFTGLQAREIVKIITRSEYDKMELEARKKIQAGHEEKIRLLTDVGALQGQTIEQFRGKVADRDTLIFAQGELIGAQRSLIEKRDKELRKSKRKSKVFLVLIGLALGLGVIF